MPRTLSLTVVIAAHNEEAALPLLHPRLMQVLDGLGLEVRVIYVDDGSRDSTWALLRGFAAEDPRIGLLRLARNFGKEVALTAGLDQVETDAALVLDADGQDPPELIPEFVARWREGWDVVYGTRISREGESWLKRFTAAGFYRVMARLSDTAVPRDTGDFRLISRPVLDALRQMRERQRFMKGLFAWVGYRQLAVPYRRAPRLAGGSKYSYWRLWNLALEGITSFSTVPLRLATYIGVATALLAFVWGLFIVIRTLAWGDEVQGWPTMMTVILFLGGLQLVALGIIGEYLGRIYLETKQRPLYLVAELRPPREGV
ncbi:MAG TPA: glycosyltransferase family 2 protein [Arenimonas sp.]|nr:glycosyltransferase family 2 protein [Arenimonas sp.]